MGAYYVFDGLRYPHRLVKVVYVANDNPHDPENMHGSL